MGERSKAAEKNGGEEQGGGERDGGKEQGSEKDGGKSRAGEGAGRQSLEKLSFFRLFPKPRNVRLSCHPLTQTHTHIHTIKEGGSFVRSIKFSTLPFRPHGSPEFSCYTLRLSPEQSVCGIFWKFRKSN